jgi:hypothetical protein
MRPRLRSPGGSEAVVRIATPMLETSGARLFGPPPATVAIDCEYAGAVPAQTASLITFHFIAIAHLERFRG